MSKQNSVRVKCVLLGDTNVGKSSLVLRYINKEFNEFSESTIGCAFNNFSLKHNNVNYKLDIWDTAGQERYRGLMPMYYRNADIVFLCVDLSQDSNEKILNDYMYWKKQIAIHNDNENRVILLIGTKNDISIGRSESDVREILDEDSYPYLETSAKNDVGVNQMFEFAIMRLSNKKSDENILIVQNPNDSQNWYYDMFSLCNIL